MAGKTNNPHFPQCDGRVDKGEAEDCLGGPPDLLERAWEARRQAVAPYSGFQVGAALRSADGHIYGGCNVENATYGLTVCAERVALFKALSEGARRFTEIAVVAGSPQLTPPCGACRQLLWEFCGDIPVYLANTEGKAKQLALADLFPSPFDSSYFQKVDKP